MHLFIFANKVVSNQLQNLEKETTKGDALITRHSLYSKESDRFQLQNVVDPDGGAITMTRIMMMIMITMTMITTKEMKLTMLMTRQRLHLPLWSPDYLQPLQR